MRLRRALLAGAAVATLGIAGCQTVTISTAQAITAAAQSVTAAASEFDRLAVAGVIVPGSAQANKIADDLQVAQAAVIVADDLYAGKTSVLTADTATLQEAMRQAGMPVASGSDPAVYLALVTQLVADAQAAMAAAKSPGHTS